MWKGSKEATIKAMLAEAKVGEIQAILKLAETIPELAPIPEWPGTMPPQSRRGGRRECFGLDQLNDMDQQAVITQFGSFLDLVVSD
eukprot:7058052-Karenia_brevis.AAC.1